MRTSVVINWCQLIYMAPLGMLFMVGGLMAHQIPAPIGGLLAGIWLAVGFIPALMLCCAIGFALIPVAIFASIFGK